MTAFSAACCAAKHVPRLQLHGDEDGGSRGQTEGRGVLPFEMERDGFLQVRQRVIHRLPLGHDGQFDTLRHVMALTAPEHRFDGSLKGHLVPVCFPRGALPQAAPCGGWPGRACLSSRPGARRFGVPSLPHRTVLHETRAPPPIRFFSPWRYPGNPAGAVPSMRRRRQRAPPGPVPVVDERLPTVQEPALQQGAIGPKRNRAHQQSELLRAVVAKPARRRICATVYIAWSLALRRRDPPPRPVSVLAFQPRVRSPHVGASQRPLDGRRDGPYDLYYSNTVGIQRPG